MSVDNIQKGRDKLKEAVEILLRVNEPLVSSTVEVLKDCIEPLDTAISDSKPKKMFKCSECGYVQEKLHKKEVYDVMPSADIDVIEEFQEAEYLFDCGHSFPYKDDIEVVELEPD